MGNVSDNDRGHVVNNMTGAPGYVTLTEVEMYRATIMHYQPDTKLEDLLKLSYTLLAQRYTYTCWEHDKKKD